MTDAAPLIGLAALISSVALLVHVSVAAWLRVKDAQRTRRSPEPDTARLIAALHDHMAGMERALEAQSIEVERLAEGQRFATRMLAEREPGIGGGALSAREPGRVITPH